MKTLKTYLARKPIDIEEVLSLTKKYKAEAETVRVAEMIMLTEAQYNSICQKPLKDYDFLSGKGGYDNDGKRTVVELTCEDKQSLYADPSGSAYCRYLGIEVK